MQNQLKSYLLFFVLVFISFSAVAQKIKLLNESTKLPISEVFVYNNNQSINTISDTNGVLNLSKFNKKDTLVFTHPSYKIFAIPYLNIGNTIYLKENPIALKPVEITADQVRQEALAVAAKIDKIDAKTIALNNPQTAAEMLELSGGVYIQKSQMGGGSPVIRGFEANRVLLVVDGVRMNNAIYRSGHLQNAITIDNAILKQTDVIYGANSVIYGSDAIGGVVHFISKSPQFAKTNDSVNNFGANSYYRYSSANNERTAHLDFNLGFKRIASLTSITLSYFDDLKMGELANSDYPDFGVEKYFSTTINNKDSMVRKKDIYLQTGTGYNQTDILEKLKYKVSDQFYLTLNTQYSTSSNVHRYDQLTTYKGDELKWAEWYYGPQNRFLTSLSAQLTNKNKWFTEGEIIASFQKIDEDRINRKFNNLNRITRNEDVNVYGLNADFHKKNSNLSEWFYGLEILHNTVKSTAFSQNIATSIISAAQTRYPDGGSTLSSGGAYLSYKNQFSEKATYSFGSRYSYSILKADFNNTTFIQLPFNSINLNNGALTGNAGLIYHPNDSWKVHIGLSTAYRSPNVDGVGKVFAKNDYVMVPNDQLKSEMAYNAELGITKGVINNKVKINVIGFYTILKNAIVRDFYQLNGQDSIQYEGETLKIQANTNTSQALVYGTSINLLANFSNEFSLKSSLNYTLGTNTSSNIPLGHIPPTYGRTDFILNSGPLTAVFYIKYQGWKKIEDYSHTGEDNETKATIDGAPPWQTFNMSAAMKIRASFMLQIALENMLDKHYRTFASGVSAPGRNLILTVRATF